MCKSSSGALAPTASRRRSRSSSSAAASFSAAAPSTSSGPDRHTTNTNTSNTTTSSTSSRSSRSSLAAARASLPPPPLLYPFHELTAATNGFLAKRDASSTYWRCSLRGRDAALFQLRALPGLTRADASAALARTARYHHASLAPLLGACLAGPHVYLAYSHPPAAASLAACLLRAGPASGSSILGTWLSRVQVAADVAQGLDYVHTHADAVHGRVSPSTVLLVPDPDGLRASLTHFGADQFAQPDAAAQSDSDVHAFGVLLLQLLSGEAEASRFRFDRATKEFATVSVLDTAAEALATGRVRTWVDRRLGDSFPVAAAEKLLEVGLRCASPEDRPPPEMSWVAGKVSKAYVESRTWARQLQHSDGLSSVSVAPR
ncbi:putative leucine-rich repeat receptor-like serine/threonine-protein kinase At2g19230 [Lolium perenne]|uniref:putative leucine-rich repeat receptor-like serine/threonine-protein kinase At2g19230 n=1 Tax=Lolium perenne TaxID=4522 RepID=UPI0021F51073|nr:putative leucine-rich repeat receptor-like serine/threonine-protein kinase At2g19230 [Lolium perenne]